MYKVHMWRVFWNWSKGNLIPLLQIVSTEKSNFFEWALIASPADIYVDFFVPFVYLVGIVQEKNYKQQ